jgi:hypothetical protein
LPLDVSVVQELRLARIQKEIENRKASIILTDWRRALDDTGRDLDHISAQIAHLQQMRSEQNTKLGETSKNIEVLVRIKQGQNEVEQAHDMEA